MCAEFIQSNAEGLSITTLSIEEGRPTKAEVGLSFHGSTLPQSGLAGKGEQIAVDDE